MKVLSAALSLLLSLMLFLSPVIAAANWACQRIPAAKP